MIRLVGVVLVGGMQLLFHMKAPFSEYQLVQVPMGIEGHDDCSFGCDKLPLTGVESL